MGDDSTKSKGSPPGRVHGLSKLSPSWEVLVWRVPAESSYGQPRGNPFGRTRRRGQQHQRQGWWRMVGNVPLGRSFAEVRKLKKRYRLRGGREKLSRGSRCGYNSVQGDTCKSCRGSSGDCTHFGTGRTPRGDLVPSLRSLHVMCGRVVVCRQDRRCALVARRPVCRVHRRVVELSWLVVSVCRVHRRELLSFGRVSLCMSPGARGSGAGGCFDGGAGSLVGSFVGETGFQLVSMMAVKLRRGLVWRDASQRAGLWVFSCRTAWVHSAVSARIA